MPYFFMLIWGVLLMAGVSAVSLIGYMNMLSSAYQGQKLSRATKAKLEALGVNTFGIKTEAQGRMKLQEVNIDRSNRTEKSKKSSKTTKTDEVLEKARQLADDLNVSYSDSDTVDDILYKISSKVEKLMSDAQNDEAKQADAVYYSGRLNEVKRMQQSQIDLNASMNITASRNIAFHGLY